jgi:hypothetical protein
MAAEDLACGRLVRAGPERFDVPIEIRLFRSPECRNPAADDLWDRIDAQGARPAPQAASLRAAAGDRR